MSETQQTAYEKWVHMDNSFKKHAETKKKKDEMKKMIDEKRNEDSRWVELQEQKRNIQQQEAERRKDEMRVLGDLNSAMQNDLQTLDKLNADEKDHKSFFSRAALECVKDPIQMQLVIFNDAGYLSNSVSGFVAKISKQKRPRKKDRENAYTKAKFVSDTFEEKNQKKETTEKVTQVVVNEE